MSNVQVLAIVIMCSYLTLLTLSFVIAVFTYSTYNKLFKPIVLNGACFLFGELLYFSYVGLICG